MPGPGDHNKIIHQLASERLKPLGLIQKGRSRTWLDDHGWWLIVVEFQPSSSSQGSYCNTGIDYLWWPKDHLAFGWDWARVQTESGDFISFSGDLDGFETAFHSMVDGAAKVTLRHRRSQGSDDQTVLRGLTRRRRRRGTPLYSDYDVAAASGLLGDMKRARKAFGRIASTDDDQRDWVLRAKDTASTLASLLERPGDFAVELADRVAITRSALKLPEASLTWDPRTR